MVYNRKKSSFGWLNRNKVEFAKSVKNGLMKSKLKKYGGSKGFEDLIKECRRIHCTYKRKAEKQEAAKQLNISYSYMFTLIYKGDEMLKELREYDRGLKNERI